jgi:hypothetical protein
MTTPRPLPKIGTKQRAVYDMILRYAQLGGAFSHHAISQSMGMSVNLFSSIIGQLERRGQIERAVVAQGPVYRIGTWQTRPLLDGRARADFDRNAKDDLVFEAVRAAAEAGAHTPTWRALAAHLGLTIWGAQGAVDRLERKGRLAHIGSGERYIIRIVATGAETVAVGPSVVERVETLTFNEAAAMLPRVNQDACWYCGVPIHRGDHRGCGAAARVVIVPKQARGMVA